MTGSSTRQSAAHCQTCEIHFTVGCQCVNASFFQTAWITKRVVFFGIVPLVILLLAVVWYYTDCYKLGLCHSKSLPSVSHFVGREEDIINITGYLDFATSDVQVVHIVGPPGFGKSTLAMKIGEIFAREWVNVHYVDVKMVKDIDTLSEKIVLAMVESRKNKATFSDLKIKMQKQYSRTLILLDNCDEIFEHSKEEFLEALQSLIVSPQTTVKYLLTSQKWIVNIGNFRLHAIYNLSSEAAIQLLGTLAPSLTGDQKGQIVDLTGNVPLALKVVGAIFSLPDAPVPEMVIRDLKEHPLRTLNRTELYPNDAVSRSIHTAYSYLTPELKQLCINLSHFPGSFDESSAHSLFGFYTDIHSDLANLVQRSLLQSSHGRQRYHFHQLIKTFFLSQENRTSFQLHFDTEFQSHFTFVLKVIISDYTNGLRLSMFDEEKHNIRHMFSLFKRVQNKTISFDGIKTTLRAIKLNVLQLRFLQAEIKNISHSMLTVLDSFTIDEQAMVNLFLDTYVRLVKLVAEQQWPICTDAIEILASREKKINEGHKSGKIAASTFTKFYSLLIQYYEDIGDSVKSTRCHTHVLKTIHGQLKHCFSNCSYYDISVAYNVIGEREKAFHFRELAYKSQLHLLSLFDQARLLLDLYNDYSHNNETIKARDVSAMVTNEVYHYLVTAEKYEYNEQLYYYAIHFFRAQNLESEVVQLQKKMINSSVPCSETNCERTLKMGEVLELLKSLTERLTEDPATLTARCEFKCAVYYAEVAEEAYKLECYYLATWAGEQSIGYFDELGEQYSVLKFAPKSFVALSHYGIGNNYSATQILLKQALQNINNAIRLNYFSWKIRELRAALCGHIILVNWASSPLLYVYFLKDFIVVLVIGVPLIFSTLPYIVWDGFSKQQKTFLNTETGLTEQKYSFIWSQFDTSYSHKIIVQWINSTVLPLAVLIIGSVIYYSCLCAFFRYLALPFVIRRRILCCILFMLLILGLFIDLV